MAVKNDALGERMKKYEYITRDHLVPRMPVIIRLDGKAFHTLTRGFKRPYDAVLSNCMKETMKYLCENIQGCVLGYTQSDEITLVLVDYKNLDSCAWFDNNIQKIVSVAASMATLNFNKELVMRTTEQDYAWRYSFPGKSIEAQQEHYKYMDALRTAITRGGMFDARVFNVPKEEVCNCILWRQNDATRNSIEMVGQAYFSHSELHKKSCNEIQDMLMTQKGINWNDYPTWFKRGSCCVKKHDTETGRTHWVIDEEIPIFKGDGRNYIDDLVYVGD